MTLKSLYKWTKKKHIDIVHQREIHAYISNGRKPWSKGYEPFKVNYISEILHDKNILDIFKNAKELPTHYGQFLDERVIEYPWLVSRSFSRPATVLDAGSITNHEYVLEHPFFKDIDLTILTAAPEDKCFFKKGISYVYADIRQLPFQTDWFDVIVCLSTLEHIGMNNEIYTSEKAFQESSFSDYLIAAKELKRVLKPGGVCFMSVPFGQYQNDIFQQQFDREMLESLKSEFSPSSFTERFYIYKADGWHISNLEECQDCTYFNIHNTKYFKEGSQLDYDQDFAAAARSVVLLELSK